MITGVRLPFLSARDPEVAGEGSLDPLRLAAFADSLADVVTPSLTARMSRIRFVTAIAVTSVVTERLEDVVPADGMTPPFLAFEWHVAHGLARDRTLPPAATLSVPGIGKARASVARNEPLGAATYLKTPRVFGFVGVYRRLAERAGVVDRRLLLADQGAELLLAWEREQSLDGFVDRRPGSAGARFATTIERHITEALLAGRVTIPNGAHLWARLVTVLRPDGAGAAEKRKLRSILTDRSFPLQHELVRLVARVPAELGEGDTVRSLCVDASAELRAHLEAIDAFEAVAEHLTCAFDTVRWISSSRGITPVSAASIAENPVVDRVARDLAPLALHASRRLDVIGRGAEFEELLGDLQIAMTTAVFVEWLIARHEQVQLSKTRRAWLDRVGDGWIVRSMYRPDTEPQLTRGYVHPYRLGAIRSFLGDLKA